MTDSQGRVVNFKNAVIIMTSNIGSATILEAMETDPASVKEKVTNQVRWSAAWVVVGGEVRVSVMVTASGAVWRSPWLRS